ncbi:MAG: leucine-rich repeat protein [Clostridiales bacterium]|nr:leucine-rich repeat protein [Clostridiales bacterium]
MKLNRNNILKKIIVFISAMTVITLLIVNCNITAKSKPTKGVDDNGNTWVYNKKTKTITFKGTKDLEENLMDGHSTEPDWFCWDEEVEHVVIKEGITGLPRGEFSLFTELKTVVLSDTVSYIGDSVFEDCLNLKEVQFSKNLIKIGDYAFAGCEQLKKIEIPKTVSSIGACAFEACSSLTEVIIPESVKKIGFEAFGECTKLKKVELPKSLKVVSEYLFFDSKSLTSVKLPESVTTIYAGAFQESGIKQIVIPKNVKYIKKGDQGNGVFADCKNLKTIEIKSKKIESCFKGAFDGVNTNVVIKVPKSKLKEYKAMFQKSGLSKKVKIKGVS